MRARRQCSRSSVSPPRRNPRPARPADHRPADQVRHSSGNVSPAWTSGSHQYDGAGNVVKIGSDWYYYDGVNRITQGTVQRGAHRQDYTYDAFGTARGKGGRREAACRTSGRGWGRWYGGDAMRPQPPGRCRRNILTIATDGGGTQTLNPSASTNRLTAAGYDAAGRMTTWTTASYSFEPLGQVQSMQNTGVSRTYRYTADGEGLADLDQNSKFGNRTIFIRSLDGKVLREFTMLAGAWSWSKDYVWRDGQLLATVTAAGTKLALLDHLGTVRRITSGAAVVGTHDVFRFGFEAPGATADGERMKFTGHERDLQGTLTDQADDLDYMHARYYNPTVGRFLSIDPVRGNPRMPQSWNLYAYVMGNPVRSTDPKGLLTYLVVYGTSDDPKTIAAYKHAAEQLKQRIESGENYSAGRDQVVVSQVKTPGEVQGLQKTKYETGAVKLSVIAHANGSALALDVREAGRTVAQGVPTGIMRAGHFSQMDKTNLAQGLPIDLFGCNTASRPGSGAPSLAQSVANGTGRIVGGFTGKMDLYTLRPYEGSEFTYVGP